MNTSTSKPDLLAVSTRAATGKRILAQLEHGTRLPVAQPRSAGWTIDGWTIGLCMLLLLMCAMAWLVHAKKVTPASFRYSGGATHSARPSMNVTSAPASVVVDNAREPEEQAAAIVNVATTSDVADAPATRDAANGDSAPLPVPATTPASAATAKSSPVVVAGASRVAGSSGKPAAIAARQATAPMAPAGLSTTPNTDTDVALLTALVAHAAKPAAATPERTRDVVERQDSDSTTQLLARCKQLGLIEGMLCRSRICSGRWEPDAACRTPAR